MLNRFDGVIDFQPLSRESINILAKKIIDRITVDIFKLYKVKVNISEKTLETVSQLGYSSGFGAWNLERTIRDEVEDKVAKIILSEKRRPVIQLIYKIWVN